MSDGSATCTLRVTTQCLSSKTRVENPFQGFSREARGTVYVPNQFFDFVLCHQRRSVIRLVSAVLRQTIVSGIPARMSYQYIEKCAGVGRAEIKAALDEAIWKGFIVPIDERLHSHSKRSRSFLYALKWDKTGAYTENPSSFSGFYSGNGRCTPTPVEFFDVVVRHETLAVVKVVGAVIRATEGWAAHGGGRVQQASLSLTRLQHLMLIGDRKTALQAIRRATCRHYIQCVTPGHFDPDGRASRAAIYSIQWRRTSDTDSAMIKQFENPTGDGTKTLPVNRRENPTGIKREETKIIHKKQQQLEWCPAEVVAASQILLEEGFSELEARRLAQSYSPERILRQIQYLSLRNPTRNRLGYLRKAIELDYSCPVTERNSHFGGKKDRGGKKQAEAKANWREYVRASAAKIRSSKPSEFAQFEAAQLERRQYLEKTNPETYRLAELQKFYSEEEQVNAIQEFFPTDILDFETWVKQSVTTEPNGPRDYEPALRV